MLTPADLQRLTMSINSWRVPDLRGCNTCYNKEKGCPLKGKIRVLEQMCLLPAFHFIGHRLVSRPPGGALDVLVWWRHLKFLSSAIFWVYRMWDPNLDSFQPQIMYFFLSGMVCTIFSIRSRLPAPHNSQPVPNNLHILQQCRSTAIQRGGQLLACEI